LSPILTVTARPTRLSAYCSISLNCLWYSVTSLSAHATPPRSSQVSAWWRWQLTAHSREGQCRSVAVKGEGQPTCPANRVKHCVRHAVVEARIHKLFRLVHSVCEDAHQCREAVCQPSRRRRGVTRHTFAPKTKHCSTRELCTRKRKRAHEHGPVGMGWCMQGDAHLGRLGQRSRQRRRP
jgi:hypothetical protein